MTGIPIPDLRFSACFDTVTTVHCKPFILKGGIPLNGTYYGAGVNSTTGVFDPSLAGPGTKRIVYSYTNSMMCSASKFRSIVVLPDPVFICGNTLTDVRDLKRYPSVKIGSQCWMAVNLDNGNAVLSTKAQTDNCISEKYCLNDNSVNCDLYGGLYQWDELMKYYGSPGGQGLCPPGWHVPTENEWSSLFNFYRGNALAGSPMKDLYFNQFNARIKGINYLNSIWSFADFATFFWSSTSLETTKAFSHGLNVYNCSVSLYSSARSNAFPVRCVQD